MGVLNEWVLALEVHPPDLESEGLGREGQDAVAAAAADALREAGFVDVGLGHHELDAGLADIDEQGEGHEGDYGWTTSHPLAYAVSATALGSTRAQVVERAVKAAADAIERDVGAAVWRHTTGEPLYLAWGVSAEARAAGSPPP